MKSDFLKYLKPLVIFSTVVAVFLFGLQYILPAPLVFKRFYVIVIFFMLISSSFHYGLLYSALGSDKGFVRFYMAASMIKLLIFLAIIIFYSLFFRASATGFVANFFFNYILFTLFEVRYLQQNFGPKR